MLAAVSRKIHLWLLSVIGIFVIITITCSEASSMVNSLDKVLNGVNDRRSLVRKIEHSIGNNTTVLLDELERTSVKCRMKPGRLCGEHDNITRSGDKQVERHRSVNSGRPIRSKSQGKVASQSRQLKVVPSKNSKSNSRTNPSDYLPVPYGPYGYQDDVSEARGWVTIPLFIFFSIIQFKLVSAIFLAFFGPMILFLLIVQGFLFKATIVLLGLMMT